MEASIYLEGAAANNGSGLDVVVVGEKGGERG